MADQKYEDKFIPNVGSSMTPAIPRERLLNRIIGQINKNTLAVSGPKMADEDAQRTGANLAAQWEDQVDNTNATDGVAETAPIDSGKRVTLSEIRRTTSTVRVTSPDDESVYVDVERIDSVLMIGSDGKTYELQFSNT